MPITLFCDGIERPNGCWRWLLFCLRQPGHTTWSSEYVQVQNNFSWWPSPIISLVESKTIHTALVVIEVSLVVAIHNGIAISPTCDQSCQLPGVAESQLQQSKSKAVYDGNSRLTSIASWFSLWTQPSILPSTLTWFIPTMTTHVSAHEDINNSSAVILAQTNPPDPEHTPNSKFFQSNYYYYKKKRLRCGKVRGKKDTPPKKRWGTIICCTYHWKLQEGDGFYKDVGPFAECLFIDPTCIIRIVLFFAIHVLSKCSFLCRASSSVHEDYQSIHQGCSYPQ